MTDLERKLALQLQAAGVDGWQYDTRFHPVRKWRADFLWVDQLLMVELQGGIWDSRGKGSHQWAKRYQEDCVKAAVATEMGYRVLWATSDMVTGGYALLWVRRMLGHAHLASQAGADETGTAHALNYVAAGLQLQGLPERQAYQMALADLKQPPSRRRIPQIP